MVMCHHGNGENYDDDYDKDDDDYSDSVVRLGQVIMARTHVCKDNHYHEGDDDDRYDFKS